MPVPSIAKNCGVKRFGKADLFISFRKMHAWADECALTPNAEDIPMQFCRLSVLTGFWLMLLTGLLPVCRADHPAPAAKPAEWTVMVYMNAKNNLEPAAFTNFDQMAAVGSSDQVHVLVEFGRPKAHYTPDTQLEGQWSKTLRFRVRRGMQASENEAAKDLGDVDMGKGETVADFVKWARDTYRAKRYLLVIWDHGEGWREYRSRALRVSRAANRPKTGISGIVRSCSLDEDKHSLLYNRDLQNSLQKTLSRKLDVIGFDACLMSMIETGYAMRDVGEVMVASQELVPGNGWNYKLWLQKLMDNPKMTGRELGEAVVTAYQEEYSGTEDTTLAATDLGVMPELADAVSKVADGIAKDLNNQLAIIKKARSDCKTYAPTMRLPYIDLELFLAQAEHGHPDEQVRVSIRRARDLLRRAVIANYAARGRLGKYGSQGLSIYYPDSEAAFEQDADHEGYRKANSVFPVEFVRKNKWVDFLEAFWQLVPN
jgi:Clostripain family